MKKYSIKLSGVDNVYSINVPGLGKNLKFNQRALEVATSIRLFLLLTLVFLLPTSGYFFSKHTNVSFDSSILIFTTLLILLSLIPYSIEIFLFRKNRIIDPTGSIFVLLFGLLITASSAFLVFSNYESSSNTFGVVSSASLKALTGLTIIVSMCFYYFVNLGIYQQTKSKDLLRTFLSGVLLFSFIYYLDNSISQRVSVYLIISPLLVLMLFRAKSLATKFAAASGLALTFIGLFTIKLTQLELNVILVSLLILSLIISYLVFSFNFSTLIKYFTDLKNTMLALTNNTRDLNISAIIHNLAKILILTVILMFPLLLIIFGLNLINGNLSSMSLVFNSYTESFNLINTEFLTLITGVGAGNITQNAPFFSSVILANGILGIAGYTMLFLYIFINVIKKLTIETHGLHFLYSVTISSIIIIIPIYGLFSKLGFLEIITFWFLATVFLSSKLTKKFQKELISVEAEQSTIKRYLNLGILLTVILILFILVYTLISNIGVLI